MKKILLTGILTMGLAAGAFAQGSVVLNNSTSAGGPAINTAANYYGGVYGLEVWELNATSVPGGINSFNGVAGGSVSAYAALASNGFTKQATFANKSNASAPGTINLGQLDMPTASGSTVTLALVMWNTSDASFNAMLGASGASTRAGVSAFTNPTFVSPSPAVQLPGWNQDLVMTTVPEPSTFALAGLGAAALLIFRRRK